MSYSIYQTQEFHLRFDGEADTPNDVIRYMDIDYVASKQDQK